MLNISLPRGDMRSFRIAVKEPSGEITERTFDDIFFTVKRIYLSQEFKFQKRLSAGNIVKDEEGYYCFNILPADTNNLAFGTYDFDIEVFKDGEIKQTTIGKLTLTAEVTYQSNEVTA